MRLVIEISENKYKYIKKLDDDITDYQTSLMIYKAIKDGIPLDKIRAEIDAIYKEDMECDGCSDMGMVLDIIDKHTGIGEQK